MNKKTLYILWAVLFILCAGLGFIPQPEGAVSVLLTVLSVVFFVPPAWLLYDAARTADKAAAALIRNLSALSLVLTVAVLILNFLSALTSEFWGNVLHSILVVVSAPMICSGYWVLSLFLWACLLMVGISQTRKK